MGRWLEIARKIADEDDDDFVNLFRKAELDPAKHARFKDWSNVDFSDCDLRSSGHQRSGRTTTGMFALLPPPKNERLAFDFTGARLEGSNFNNARIQGCRFDQAILGQVIQPDNPHDEGRLTAPVADLSRASDWTELCRSWERSKFTSNDSHLPVGAVFQDTPFAPPLVVVPAGSCTIGPRENPWRNTLWPPHTFHVDQPFAVGRFAVTFEEWDFAQNHPLWQRLSGIPPRRAEDFDWGRGRQPVVDVSWADASAYCNWLTGLTGLPYQLLSDEYWEYACRAGTQSAYSFGEKIDKSQVHFSEGKAGSALRTIEVGSLPANSFGLHEMHGNVREFCADRQSYTNGNNLVSHETANSNRLFRVTCGGSWVGGAESKKSSSRAAVPLNERTDFIGFRVMRPLGLTLEAANETLRVAEAEVEPPTNTTTTFRTW